MDITTQKQEAKAGKQLLILLGSVFLGVCLLSAITFLVMKMDGLTADVYNTRITREDVSIISFIKKSIVIQPFVVFILPTLFFAKVISNKPIALLKLQPPGVVAHLILGFILLMVSMPLVTYLGKLNEILLPKYLITASDFYKHTFNLLLNDMQQSKSMLFMICTAGFLAGFSEELLFRAGLQNILFKLFKNHWVAIITTGFVFSLAHFEFTGFLPRFALGVLLGVIYFYSNSIWPSVIAHCGFNIMQVIGIYKGVDTDAVNVNFLDKRLIIAAVISLILTIFIVYWFKKTSKAPITIKTGI
jgi:uncharacterized protein